MPKPPSLGIVTSAWGMRRHPITGVYRMHYGEDTNGDGNYAPVSGTVVFAGYDTTGMGFGYAVGIRETANPDRIWWTAHHSSLSVKVGYRVIERRTRIGPMGQSGAATGAHAHQEVRVGGTARPGSGTAINPRPLYTSGGGASGGGIIDEGNHDMFRTIRTKKGLTNATSLYDLFTDYETLTNVPYAEIAAYKVAADVDHSIDGTVTSNAKLVRDTRAVWARIQEANKRNRVQPSQVDAAAVAALVIPAVVAALEPKFAAVNANIDDQPTEFTVTPK